MPGFGDNPDDDDDLDDDVPGDGMFTDEMVCSVAKYEASLGADSRADHRRLRPRLDRGARPPPPADRRGDEEARSDDGPPRSPASRGTRRSAASSPCSSASSC